MRRTILLLVCLACAVGSTLAAARIEISPMGGYRWGGEIKASNTSLFDSDSEIDEAASYGLALGILPRGGFVLELSVDRQHSAFLDNNLLFEQSNELFDVDTTYYHVGAGYSWTGGSVEPFLSGSLGVLNLDPDVAGSHSEDKFSTSFGGGVKVWANPHFGFRFELRGYWANTDEDDNDCEICPGDDLQDDLYQGQARIGLVVAF